jgi:uncharacterized membrane protein
MKNSRDNQISFVCNNLLFSIFEFCSLFKGVSFISRSLSTATKSTCSVQPSVRFLHFPAAFNHFEVYVLRSAICAFSSYYMAIQNVRNTETLLLVQSVSQSVFMFINAASHWSPSTDLNGGPHRL